MALERYKDKRSFTETPEPEGEEKRTSGPLRFVVQKHRASHLHYDFRLELDGVLKSWAVPKGPSLDPADKRLAMMVEDHPFDYRTFEGNIPEGNYGAGEVIIWDEGFYSAPGIAERKEAEQRLRDGLEKGDLKIFLYGTKLKGEFVLAKTKSRDGRDNSWLLIKKKDEFASTEKVTEKDRSVVSGRRIEDLREDGGAMPKRGPGILEFLKGAPKTRMPRNISPMLALLQEEAFDRKDWLFEVKWDGFRGIAEVEGGKVKLYSRNQISLKARFPEIADALEEIGHDVVLDGEIVVLDQKGKPQFQLIQNYHREKEGILRYYLFDILYLDGYDLRKKPLVERKEILKRILPESEYLQLSEHVETSGLSFYAAAERHGLEGVMAKNGHSPYREGKRTGEWQKIKILNRQEAVIVGFTAPRGSRKNLGALILGVYDKGKLRYIGHTGGGSDPKILEQLHRRLKPLIRETSALDPPPKTNSPVTWVEPSLVCEVKFQEWTTDGRMRQPVLLGFREDKPSVEVESERVKSSSPEMGRRVKLKQQNEGRGLLVGGRVVELTNLEKFYWPREKITKGDLVSYYREVAPVILPHLKDRPESLHRHPSGINGESFFQKNVDHMPPHWVKAVEIYSESNAGNIRYLLCQDEATLVYMTNLGCIELNPWLSRVGHLEEPDYVLLDLDPEGIGFDKVIEAAQILRKTLDKLGVESYVKTSGATGLHILVPLGARYDYEQAKRFAEMVMNMVHLKLPKTTSVERKPEKRQKRIYLDFLQNRKGQTMAAPYCVRPRTGAPVSAPLEWKEVKRGLDPMKFTIKTMAKRLEKKGDLWAGLLKARGVDLRAILRRMA